MVDVVSDALSQNSVTAPIREMCLRMMVITPLLKQILEAQVGAMKEEH